jgi:hypothetical protein
MQHLVAHRQSFERLKALRKLKRCQRHICVTCGVLLVSSELVHHKANTHKVLSSLSRQQLRTPSRLLQALADKQLNAQYLFSDRTVDFLVNVIVTLKKSAVLCVGTPRLFEAIRTFKAKQHETVDIHVTSLLLDIDYRLEQFFGPRDFCRYNMFNHHFFGGEESHNVYLEFLRASKDLLIVIDPPFGGLIDVLAFTMQSIVSDYNSCCQGLSVTVSSLPTLLFFPYFMEKRIISTLPSFTMLDYQVDYENHSSFCETSGDDGGNVKHSPVRIFTNLDAASVALPAADGYWFCVKCQRYSSSSNKHCDKCYSCTTKAGQTYVHCDVCHRCVKSTWIHCIDCNACELPGRHSTVHKSKGCHICGQAGHRRRQCPKRQQLSLSQQTADKISSKKHCK